MLTDEEIDLTPEEQGQLIFELPTQWDPPHKCNPPPQRNTKVWLRGNIIKKFKQETNQHPKPKLKLEIQPLSRYKMQILT